MSSDLTRPIIGIENRTAQEVFDIMCDRIRRSASPSIGRVGVKALEWQGDKAETPFGPYTVIRTPDGYQSRFQRDEIAHVGFNAVDMFYGARRAAQDHAQADYESRIRSTLVYHEEPAGDTQGAAKPVAWRAITVAGNVLYFAANDKPVEPSWEIIPLYAAPAALVSPPDNGEAAETQESIGAWADETFGVVTDLPRAVGRAGEELAELKEAAETLTPQDMIVEMADVVIVLMRLANVIGQDLTAAINAKMAINRQRVWKTDGTGHGYHVKQPALQSHNEGSDGVGNDNDGREDSQP